MKAPEADVTSGMQASEPFITQGTMLGFQCCAGPWYDAKMRATRVAELEAHGGPAGGAQTKERLIMDEATLREVALRGRVLELEAACSAETLGADAAAQPQVESLSSRPADEAALREVALLRSRVLELEAACSAGTLNLGVPAAQQQAEAPCSPAPDPDGASHAHALGLETAAHGELAALRRRVLKLEAAHSSVQAPEGAGPWRPASSDSSAAEAGPLMALPQDGVLSSKVAPCPCLPSNMANRHAGWTAAVMEWCRKAIPRAWCWSQTTIKSLLSAWIQDELSLQMIS